MCVCVGLWVCALVVQSIHPDVLDTIGTGWEKGVG